MQMSGMRKLNNTSASTAEKTVEPRTSLAIPYKTGVSERAYAANRCTLHTHRDSIGAMENAFIAIAAALGTALGFILARPQRIRLRTQLEERTQQLEAAQADLGIATNTAREFQERLSSTEAEVLRYRSVLDERERADAQRQEHMETHFKGLASDVLRSAAAELHERASEQLTQQRELASSEHKAREAAITSLAQPIREGLESLRRHVDQSDKARSTATAQMHDQVERMIAETTLLRDVLHNPQLRGAWGEQSLHNMLEIAGLQQHVDFIPQLPLKADGHGLRPDVVVSIPGGIEVVIDAKTPHEVYSKAVRAGDQDERKRLLEQHAAALFGHVRELGSRDYSRWVKESPDFVIMYVPTDPILDAAMEAKPAIWQDAIQQHKVLIATPGLLVAFLRTVALAWQQESIQKNAQQIADAGRALYGRLGTFAGHLGRVGSSLNAAVASYNKSVASFDSRLAVQARRFEKLGVVGETESLVAPHTLSHTAITSSQLSKHTESAQHDENS